MAVTPVVCKLSDREDNIFRKYLSDIFVFNNIYVGSGFKVLQGRNMKRCKWSLMMKQRDAQRRLVSGYYSILYRVLT